MVKNPFANANDAGSISGSGRSPGGGNGTPLQYSSLDNPMDRGAWQARAHKVAKSRTRLKRLSTHAETHVYLGLFSCLHLTSQNYCHDQGLSFPHSSVGKESACSARGPGLIPGLGRSPGEGKSTPVFLPGKSHAQRSLEGYSPRGRKSWT